MYDPNKIEMYGIQTMPNFYKKKKKVNRYKYYLKSRRTNAQRAARSAIDRAVDAALKRARVRSLPNRQVARRALGTWKKYTNKKKRNNPVRLSEAAKRLTSRYAARVRTRAVRRGIRAQIPRKATPWTNTGSQYKVKGIAGNRLLYYKPARDRSQFYVTRRYDSNRAEERRTWGDFKNRIY